MPAENYYYLAALPPLEDLQQAPPISPPEMLEQLEDSDGYDLVEAVLLSDDLLQRESALAGELTVPAPAVLSPVQVRGEEPLPPKLQTAETVTAGPRAPSDVIWATYYQYAMEVAERRHSQFLADWVGYEVALRNALVAARAKALELEPTDYLVAPELGSGVEDYTQTVNEWASAENPLAGQRALDRARWRWLTTHDRHFTFSNDELAAYAAKLLL
ncbi:MAG: DUF2764 family protein, partial [Planctomycetota bacterium]